jgi:formylmethanofuran dehydrogenase subunit E
MKKISLSDAVRFHGHLGPWLVVGLKLGEVSLNRLSAKKYFGLDVRVWGALKRPRSCLVDGLQLSTGATYGKGNIKKFNASSVKVVFRNNTSGRTLTCRLSRALGAALDGAVGCAANERLARKLYRSRPDSLFRIT